MTTRLHLRRRERSRGDIGTMDLGALSARAVAAIVGQGGDSPEVRDGATTLIRTLEATTRTLAERTHAEFTAAIGWTVEQRQNHALRAIVERVDEAKGILAGAGLGPDVVASATDLLRETYFSRLTTVALGSQRTGGKA